MQIAKKTYAISAERTPREKINSILSSILRIFVVILLIAAFVSDLNPGRVNTVIVPHFSLFTTGFTNSVASNVDFLISRGDVNSGSIVILRLASILTFVGLVTIGLGVCMTLAAGKKKQIGGWLPIAGAIVMLLGIAGIQLAHRNFNSASELLAIDGFLPYTSIGFYFYAIAAVSALVIAIAIRIVITKDDATKTKKHFKIPEKYKLFLYALPILILTMLMSFLPLWGWRFAFFDVPITGEISRDTFVGLQWFRMIFDNPHQRRDILIVLRNTLAMSGLGIASSILPVFFAMFFAEIKSRKLGRVIQTFTTLPNFISWVLIFAFAFALFSDNGVINNIFGTNTNILYASGAVVWLQMLLWGVWRSLGWSAIIYIAAISGIDQGMYEAASIDGAKRFDKMRHITFPSLMPTFSVMLLLAFAGILSNGFEQYFMFANALNDSHIRVLDLYVYQIGIGDGMFGLATVIGMLRTLISLVLLFIANWVSKIIRGESII